MEKYTWKTFSAGASKMKLFKRKQIDSVKRAQGLLRHRQIHLAACLLHHGIGQSGPQLSVANLESNN